MSIREVTTAELEAAMDAGAKVVDVREADEYQSGHVPGALHVALGTVPDHVESFRSDGTTYVICRSGARSMRACEFVAEHGIDVVNVAGGTLDWVRGGRPVVAGSSPL